MAKIISQTENLGTFVNGSPPQGVTLNSPVASGTFAPTGGQVGVAYSYETSPLFSGDSPIDTYSIGAGTLPGGLSINISTGEISGTPTTEETQAGISITGTNAGGSDTTNTASIVIAAASANPPIASGTFAPPSGIQNTAYSYDTSALFTGGAPTSYSLETGTLPTNLSLNTSTGEISGTPTVVETETGISITATNGDGSDTTNTASLNIAGATGQVIMSVATADVPPDSLVYGKTVSISDTLDYATSTAITGGGTGTINSVDTLGVPTITGAYGNHVCTIDINSGGSQDVNYPHVNVATLMTAFTLPAQDSDGWTIIPTPESTARLIYVDPTGGDDGTATNYTTGTIPGTHFRTDPGAVNAYDTFAGAVAQIRDGEGDYILFKRGETFTVSATKVTLAGKSHTYPHVFCDYGSGVKPILRAHPTIGQGSHIFSGSTADSYNHFYNLYFWNQYRDPSHADFVGYGLTEFGAHVLNFYPGFQAGVAVDGIHIEGCVFEYGGMKFGSSPNLITAVIRRNYIGENYSESDNMEGLFSKNATLLIEENCSTHNGWIINRDRSDTIYPLSVDSANHDGANGATTFTSTGAGFDTKGVGALCVKTGSATEYGRIDTLTADTATATLAAEHGGGSMTFDTNDRISIRGHRMRGQANGKNHNFYTPAQHGTIYRNNLIMDAASSGIKLTGVPDSMPADHTGTHDGANGATTFSDAGASYPSLTGALVTNITNAPDRYAIVQTNNGTTLTAYYTPHSENAVLGTGTGTGLMVFNTGDQIEISEAPFDYPLNDVCIYSNYFVGNPVDLSADLNVESRDYQNRIKDLRLMNNVGTKEGYENRDSSIGEGSLVKVRWWQDGCISNNIVTTLTADGNSESGISFGRDSDDLLITNNIFYDIGKASGTAINSNRGYLNINPGAQPRYDISGLKIMYNDFQAQNTDHILIGTLESGEGFTWEGNRYFSTRTSLEWAEIDDSTTNIAGLVAETGETGYSETAVSYVNAQTHEGYMADIGEATTTIAQLASLYKDMILDDTWAADYETLTAEYIVGDFKKGYEDA